MELGEKLARLRALEGERRGLGRPMTQAELSEAMRRDHGKSLSQAYLSQIENGKRPHLSNDSRALLAKFFGVHPGHLVSDPTDFEPCAGHAAPQTPTGPTAHALRGVPGLASLSQQLATPGASQSAPPAPHAAYTLPASQPDAVARLAERLRASPQRERITPLIETLLLLSPAELDTLRQTAQTMLGQRPRT